MDYSRSLPEIAVDVVRETVTLLKTEARLAFAEMSQNVGTAGRGVGLLVAGGVLLIPALVLLLQAGAAAAIAAGLADYWAFLIFGGGALVLAVILMLVGRQQLKVSNLKPKRTLEELKRDVTVATEQIRAVTGTTQRPT